MGLNVQLPDFDTLVALHQEDPAAFEDFRKQLLRDCVKEAPADQQPALEALLEHIDAVRESATTPLEAAAAATRLMMESAVVLRTSMGQLLDETAAFQTILVLQKFRL